MDQQPRSSDRELRTLLALLEPARAAVEGAALASVSPWLSLAPRGDGHGVMVLPGFAASDTSTQALRRFLQRQGYAVFGWEQGRNLGPARMGGYAPLLERVEQLTDETGGSISLVGWSLGGVYARALAKMAPDRIRQVLSLGSPIGGAGRTSVARVYERVTGRPIRRDERVVAELIIPPPMPSTAIYSRTDGVVPWQLAREATAPQTDNIEVFGSHLGLGVNPAVLFAVADRLAQQREGWQPFHRRGWRAAAYGPALAA